MGGGSASSSWDDCFVEVTSADVSRVWVDDGDNFVFGVNKPCLTLFVWPSSDHFHFMYPPKAMLGPDCYDNGLVRLPKPGMELSDSDLAFERFIFIENAAFNSYHVYVEHDSLVESVLTQDFHEVQGRVYPLHVYVPWVDVEKVKGLLG